MISSYPSTTKSPHRRTNRHKKRKPPFSRLRLVVCLSGAALLLTFGSAVCLSEGGGATPSSPSPDGIGYQVSQQMEDLVNQLTWSDADEDDRLAYILNHPEEYTTDLLELAQKNSEAIDYVYQYPQLCNESPDIDLSQEAASDTVPLLLQWDTRWGYQVYGSGLIGYTGCGPTCLSMVALYLTGNADYTPAFVAEYAYDHGYYVSGSGTAWSLMTQGCTAFGLTAQELSLSESAMATALANGSPIICSMGPGDFTDNGHYIVITGYTGDAFTVNDPNSPQRSSQLWSFDQLEGQIRNLWAFSAG